LQHATLQLPRAAQEGLLNANAATMLLCLLQDQLRVGNSALQPSDFL